MIQYISSGEAAKLLGVARRTLLRWEEQGILRSRRDQNGNRVYRKQHVAVAKNVSDQWKAVRRRHREHLRKLPAIQKKVEQFVTTKPLERTNDPEPLSYNEMKEAFYEMREWEKENEKIHKLYHEFYTGEVVRYAKSFTADMERL